MIALFEGGNSRLHSAWWDGVALSNPRDVPYPGRVDELAGMVVELMGTGKPSGVAACSVSRDYGEPLFETLERLLPGMLSVARTAADAGVRVMYDRPESYGVDRALAAAAAYREVRGACVVVDAGTAVTVDAVDDDGIVRGGFIFPGGETLAVGLASRTGLPYAPFDANGGGLGTSTRTCIGHALKEGLAGAVEALVRSARTSVGGTARVFFTGGEGEFLARMPGIGGEYRYGLVLKGLGIVASRLPKYA